MPKERRPLAGVFQVTRGVQNKPDDIPNSATFRKLTDPGVFTPAPNRTTRTTGAQPLTLAETATQKAQYEENARLYNECQRVELALRNQLFETIEPIYLKPSRNRNTDTINNPIPEIITCFTKQVWQDKRPKTLRHGKRGIGVCMGSG